MFMLCAWLNFIKYVTYTYTVFVTYLPTTPLGFALFIVQINIINNKLQTQTQTKIIIQHSRVYYIITILIYITNSYHCFFGMDYKIYCGFYYTRFVCVCFIQISCIYILTISLKKSAFG